jgi:hypothetical protein
MVTAILGEQVCRTLFRLGFNWASEPKQWRRSLIRRTTSAADVEYDEEYEDLRTHQHWAIFFRSCSENPANSRSKQNIFEDLISGYEDRAHVDDLGEAYEVLESIIKEISPKDV